MSRLSTILSMFAMCHLSFLFSMSALDETLTKIKAELSYYEWKVSYSEKLKEDNELRLACAQGNREIVQTLLAHGISVNAKLSHGKTALHVAARAGARDLVLYLCHAGAVLEAIDDAGMTPLHDACFNNGLESLAIVNFLIEQGADAERQDMNGYRAIHWAAYNEPVLSFLVDSKKVQIDVSDNRGMTPLHWACRKGCLDVVKYLIGQGANPEIADKSGYRAIHWAVYHLDICKFLHERKVDMTAKDTSGKTAYDWARQYALLRIVAPEIEKFLEVTTKNQELSSRKK